MSKRHPPLIAGLDIGTHAVKLALAKKNEETGELELLGVAEESSFGVRKGSIRNGEEVVRRIASVRTRGENMVSREIEEVSVNVGGSHLFVMPSRGIVAVSRADGEISDEDVERVLQAAQAFSLPKNKEILEVFPLQFIVDGEGGIKEAAGMKGVRLEAEVLAICAFSPYLKAVADAVLGSGMGVADIVPSPIMAAPAVLSPQLKELGVMLLDVGAGTTGMSVFEEGELVHMAVLPVGSENITRDIAVGLQTEHEIAERIKKEFGSAGGSQSRKSEKVELPGGEILSFSVKELSKIIDSRLKEMFQLVNKELKAIGREKGLPGGVVLVGGGVGLPNIVEFAKKELKLPVRIGELRGIHTPARQDPSLLGVLGLVLGRAADAENGRAKEGQSPLGGVSQKAKRLLKMFIP